MKKIVAIIVVALISGTTGFYLAKSKPFFEYFSSPTVTLINMTGNTIFDVTISLGPAKRTIPNLKQGQSISVSICGKFGESSTNIKWTKSQKVHTAIAGDYMENYGFYHSTILLTENNKAIAIMRK